ncbi:MAG: DMT family transporter [Terriglobia bacterium]
MHVDPAVESRHTTHDVLSAVCWMMIAMAFWTALENVGRMIPLRYSPYQTVWTRYGVHLLFMIAIFGPRRGIGLVTTRRPLLQIARSLLMVVMPVSFILAVVRMNVNLVWGIFWVSPLLALVLARLLLREFPSGISWATGLAGFIGSWVLLRPRFPGLGKSLVLPLIMAFCFALYLIMTRLLRHEGSIVNLFYTALVVFVCLSAALPLFWQPPNLRSFLAMAAIGLLGWVVLLGLDKALALLPAVRLAPFAYIQLVWSQLLGVSLLGQPIGVIQFSGLAIILGGVALLLRYELRCSRKVEWETLRVR